MASPCRTWPRLRLNAVAKVKLANVSPRAFSEARGRLMLMIGPHGAVMAKWPRKRGKAKQGYDLYRQLEFGAMAKWAASPLDLDLGTAVEMAKGTEQVPRDILMMAMQGGYYEIVSPEGIVWEQARMTTNAQYILDQVTDAPGALLYRSPTGWMGLLPGIDGQVLQTRGDTVIWGAPDGAPSQQLYGRNTWAGDSTSNYGTKGAYYRPLAPHSITGLVGEIDQFRTGEFYWGVYEVDSAYTITAVVAKTLPFVKIANAVEAKPAWFNSPAPVEVGKNYALLLTRSSSPGNTPAGLRAGSGDPTAVPTQPTNRYLAYATNDPQVGQTIGNTGDNPYSYGVFALRG